MRFMVMVKASADSEAGKMPDPKLIADMSAFNEEMAKAGILLAAEGLHPSSRGYRMRFDGDERTVLDGPFAETKELIAGFWILDVRSDEEVLEWMRRSPPCHEEGPYELEIRKIFEPSDFPSEGFPPEEIAKEEQFRRELAQRAAGKA